MNLTIHNSKYINDKLYLPSSNFDAITFIMSSFIINKMSILENVNLNKKTNTLLECFEKINAHMVYPGINSISFLKYNPYKLDVVKLDLKDNEDLIYYIDYLFLNFAKRLEISVNKEIDITNIKDKMKNNNFSVVFDKDKYIFSGSVSNDYYHYNNVDDDLYGLIFSLIYNGISSTILLDKSSEKVDNFIKMLNVMGFNVEIQNNIIYIHSYNATSWDQYTIKGCQTLSSYFIINATLNGNISLINPIINVLNPLIDLIKSCKGNIRIDKEKGIIEAYNSGLLQKGIAKKLEPINVSLSIDNLYYLYLGLFTKGISNFKIIDNKDMILSILDNLKIIYKTKDDIISIKGNDSYNLDLVIDCKNNLKLSIFYLFFALLNNKKIILENIDIIYDIYPSLVELLKEKTKYGALE